MTHFENADTANYKDHIAIESIKKLDSELLLNNVKKNQISMCGIFPTMVLIESINEYKKLSKAKVKVEEIAYGNSGELTKDFSEVVGYAGIIFKKA